MATHSSILAGKISWTEEPGGLVRRVKESDTTDATEQACLHVPLVSPPSHHPTKSRKNQKPNRAICHLSSGCRGSAWLEPPSVSSESPSQIGVREKGRDPGDAGAPTDLLKWPGRSALSWQTDARGPGGLCQEEKRARRKFWGLEAQTAPCSSSIQISKTNHLTQGLTRAQALGFPAGPSALSGHLLEARCSGECQCPQPPGKPTAPTSHMTHPSLREVT